MQEIMILRKNVDNETRLKTFLVDETTLAKLTRIRGTLYQDDPRLRIVKDHPTPEPEPKISPEMQARAEASWLAHCMARDAGMRAAASTPEPKPLLSFEEQIQNDWRTRPDIRAEFISLASYEAYCKAVRDGRCKSYSV